MAFDPLQEDCLRVILAAMERENSPASPNILDVEHLAEAFDADPSSLIKTDAERSFHLVAMAAKIIDYQAPHVSDEAEAESQIHTAEGYLREACELDPGNWDAQRMLAALQTTSDDEFITYLTENREEVFAATARMLDEAQSPYQIEFASDLGRRPLLRWIGVLAARLLVSGRYRMALTCAEEGLELDPRDMGGIRHTGMLALSKLEVAPEELDRYRARHAVAYQVAAQGLTRRGRMGGHKPDAWTLISQMSLAYRRFDYEGATKALKTLMRIYPQAGLALYFQTEFPDGVFARVHVQPGSLDELALALSEATPLLQEGIGTPEAASFSLWVSQHELVQQAYARHALSELAQTPGDPGGSGA